MALPSAAKDRAGIEPTIKADLDDLDARLVSTTDKVNIGATAPTPTYAGQVWVDTNGAEVLLKVRNKANTAWLGATLA